MRLARGLLGLSAALLVGVAMPTCGEGAGGAPAPAAEVATPATSPTSAAVAVTPTASRTSAASPEAATPTSATTTPVTSPRDEAEEERFAKARDRLIEEIDSYDIIKDRRVLEAIRRVPRHEFVLPDYLDEAYANHPLPIGEGQTISEPLIVAHMTESLQIEPGDRVLEIGTGSGYQAAVLVEMGAEVYSIEIIPTLGARARENLTRLGYASVTLKIADGYYGWEEHAPFDAIIVTAAPDHVPQPLVRQLAVGGRMVIPVGPVGFYQTLWVIERREDGLYNTNLGGCLFVPFTGPGVEEHHQ